MNSLAIFPTTSKQLPGVFRNLLLAFALAIAGGLFAATMQNFIGWRGIGRCLLPMLFGVYAIYLLANSPLRHGRVVGFAGWLTLAVFLFWFNGPLLLTAAIHLIAIGLLRCLAYHSTLLATTADFALLGGGALAALWSLMQTGSIGLAVWCFFLVQSLFVRVPSHWPRHNRSSHSIRDDDHFERARANAEAALRRLYR